MGSTLFQPKILLKPINYDTQNDEGYSFFELNSIELNSQVPLWNASKYPSMASFMLGRVSLRVSPSLIAAGSSTHCAE